LVTFNVNSRNFNFLVDTGASICAIKYECLLKEIPIIKEKLEIKGIGGQVFSEGYVFLKLKIRGKYFMQKFYVFKNLSLTTDGIIGKNFLKKYNAVIDFEKDTLS